MIQFTKFLITLLLVNCLCSDAVYVFQDPYTDFNEVKAYSSATAISPNGKNILYMACNEVRPKYKKSSDTEDEKDKYKQDPIVCDLKLEVPSDNGSYLRSCNDVQIIPRGLEYTLKFYVPTLQFINETKIAIKYFTVNSTMSFRPSKYHFKIFDLVDCTTAADFHFTFKPDDDKQFLQILVPHDKYLEVFALDQELCGEMGGCIVKYTLDGATIGQPTQLPLSFMYNVNYINNSMPEKGYYLFGIKSNSTNKFVHPGFQPSHIFISYIDTIGNETEVMGQDSANGFPMSPMSFTNSRELFSGCWLVAFPYEVYEHHTAPLRDYRHDIIQCVQFDKTVMKANVTLKMDNPTFALAVHTLSNGEMILATGDMKVDNSSNARVESFHIYKIGSNGAIGQSLLVRGLDLKFKINDYCTDISMSIAESSKDQLCVSIATLGPNLNHTEPRVNTEDSQYVQKCVPMHLLNNL